MRSAPSRCRIDKWLWAARFYKTRSLANNAVQGGHVHLNGSRVKPSRAMKVGDLLEIRKGSLRIEVEVVELSVQRGPASVATLLYRETGESIAWGEQERLRRKEGAAMATADSGGRPDKRQRRQILRLTERQRS